MLQEEWTAAHEAISNSGQLSASASGDWVAVAGRDASGASVVRILDTNHSTKVAELIIGTNTINAVALSPDKQRLAVYLREINPNSVRNIVSVWNVRTKQCDIRFPLPGPAYEHSACGAVAFSPDGEVLAIGQQSGQVRLVDARREVEKTVIPGQFVGSGVSTLAYSPDGRLLAAGGAFTDPRILIWDTETNKKLATLDGHLGFISQLTFSPDGKTLASASADQTVKLWSTDTWKEKVTFSGHNDEVWSVESSSDGKQLVSSGKDGYVCVWPASGRPQDSESAGPPGRSPGAGDIRGW